MAKKQDPPSEPLGSRRDKPHADDGWKHDRTDDTPKDGYVPKHGDEGYPAGGRGKR